ncbi:solute carrier family 35 member F1-like [Cynara cardunculus var. scolymus]|uniref:solute carrier family 35 member F1-like n=1 Tax=Cynara cardunculus var. scolymus TaxID=59895 RepID=UPI000D62500F|nr:solute carrier family 35 member F1-like [Cynara cardunculus var. scolymus]
MNSEGVKYGGFWRVLYAVLLGQLTSFSMALVSFSSSLSANLGVNAPFTLSFFSYLALTLVFGSILLYRRQKLHISWYWYVLLAIVDVHGSYLFNKAYQFSSITSVTILDCATIVWVIILTWLFLGTKYSLWQFLGAALCVTGLCLVLLSDSGVGGGGGSNPILGDALVIAGTCFFAVSNVGEEFCVKKVGRIEVITMLGLFGMLMSVVEMVIFERKNLESVSWSAEVILTFAGYGLASFMFCSLRPLVLQASGATLFNLSLLTADMWAVVIRVFLYHQKVDWLYYVSFLLVGIGLVIYSKPKKHTNELSELEDGDTYLLPPEKDSVAAEKDSVAVASSS